ncbi:MAG: flagellar basal body P-ring protein FlgI [SAR324 cluster bacterium]|nr:flagellar basal body P-ring protein FlgI [SAR324 cluster bacterium]
MTRVFKASYLIVTMVLIFGLCSEIWGVRVKDIANLRGARNNQLTGFGIVVGLDGTGDSEDSLLSRKPVINALERMGISLAREDVTGRSIAAVWLTATLPPFAKAGQRIDTTVSTIGDAVSLRGGVLVMTPLRGPNRLVYAVAQGPVVGIPRGVSRDNALPEEQKYPLLPSSSMVASVGMVPGGALVERELNLSLNSRSRIYFNLRSPDFTTAHRLEKIINRALGYQSSRAKDAGTVEIAVPQSYLGKTVELVSYIENLEITPDNVAKVVLDERTGTIVMGEGVRISPIAISQGNLSILVKLPDDPAQADPQADQAPGDLTPEQAAQQFLNDPNTIRSDVFMLKGGADLKEVVDGFNKIGATSDDLVHVLKAVKAAGALHAELNIR